MTSERGIFSDLHDINSEVIAEVMKRNLMSSFGITEEEFDKLDPYKWAYHDARYRLWIARKYIELIEPEDPRERFSLLMGRLSTRQLKFTEQLSLTFRHLDENNVDSFKEGIRNLGFKINLMPSKEGPWRLLK